MSEAHVAGKKSNQIAAIIFQKRITSKPLYKGIVMINNSITYPQFEIKNNLHVAQSLNEFYRNDARQYYQYSSQELYNAAIKEFLYDIQQHFPFREYQVVQTFETTYNRTPLLSIYYDRYEFSAGAHGTTTRASNTWFVPNGAGVELSNLFEGSYYKGIIYEYITNEINKQMEQGDSYYFDDYAKKVFRYFDENNYYITDSGFAFYFPQYTIAAYAQGIPVFLIPYDVFGHGLKQRFFE